MALDIDVTKLPVPDRIIPGCKVVDLGSGDAPKFITVELPRFDGARVLAYWTGNPGLDVDDYVRIQRRGFDKQYDVIGTDRGTVDPGGAGGSALAVDQILMDESNEMLMDEAGKFVTDEGW